MSKFFRYYLVNKLIHLQNEIKFCDIFIVTYYNTITWDYHDIYETYETYTYKKYNTTIDILVDTQVDTQHKCTATFFFMRHLTRFCCL